MPTYEYECEDCEHRFDIRQGINDLPLEECPECGGTINRVIHASPVHFKGGGFYTTDSKPDTRVKGESGKLGRKVSDTDSSNIAEEQVVDSKGHAKATPTQPKPVGVRPGRL